MAPATLTDTKGTVESRITATEHLLRDQVARIRRGTLVTTIVGFVVLLLLAGYFIYGYREIKDLLKPATLANYAGQMIEDRTPEARKSLEEEVQKSATSWAANLSRQARDAMPSVRTELEEYVLRQINAKIDETVQITEGQFRDFLRDNRTTLEQGFVDLSTSPELAENSLNQLQTALERRFQVSMQEGAGDMFTTLNHWNDELGRLKSGNTLTREERLYREILSIARRLQFQEAEAGSSASASASATQ